MGTSFTRFHYEANSMNHEGQNHTAIQSLIPDGYRICKVCGYTDLRKSIQGMFDIADLQYGVSPMENNAFLFCGGRCDRIKIFYYLAGSFHLHYMRATETRYQWYRRDKEIWVLSREQLEKLFSGERIMREQIGTIIPSRV